MLLPLAVDSHYTVESRVLLLYALPSDAHQLRCLLLCLLLRTACLPAVQRHNPRTDRFQMHKFHHVEFWCGDATNTSCR